MNELITNLLFFQCSDLVVTFLLVVVNELTTNLLLFQCSDLVVALLLVVDCLLLALLLCCLLAQLFRFLPFQTERDEQKKVKDHVDAVITS